MTITKTIIYSCSGIVDVLNDELFLVTLKNARGLSVQLSFPLELAVSASLTVGDFVSYLVVGHNGKIDHEFRKESPPEISPSEAQEIDDFVDRMLAP